MLEMDSAFQGSVCRCSACGALIKVPRRKTKQDPSRPAPERPDHPVDLPAATLASIQENTNDEPDEAPIQAELATGETGSAAGWIVGVLVVAAVLGGLFYAALRFDLI